MAKGVGEAKADVHALAAERRTRNIQVETKSRQERQSKSSERRMSLSIGLEAALTVGELGREKGLGASD